MPPLLLAQVLSTTITTLTVVLIFCTTAAETAVGNWLYTYGVREVSLIPSVLLLLLLLPY